MSTPPQRSDGALALLTLRAGPRHGEQLPVPAPVVTIGRGEENAVVVPDDSVSVSHARLEWDAGGWRITDLDSTNGTSVEGVRLAPQVPTPLPYGSTVRLGGVQLQLCAAEEEVDLEGARAAYREPERERTLREERAGPRFPLWLAALIVVLLVVLAFVLLGTDVFAAAAQAPAGAPAAPLPPHPAAVP